jgi:DNA (cytosine-5)-methyltransferase 1
MGYPDEMKIVCSDTRAYKQFGNSVAVPVVTAISQQLVDALTGKSKRRPSIAAQPGLFERPAFRRAG